MPGEKIMDKHTNNHEIIEPGIQEKVNRLLQTERAGLEINSLCFWRIPPPLGGAVNHENTQSMATEDWNTAKF